MIEKKQKIQLVEGIFSFEEAAEVLFSLLMHKIKFHSLQILNNQSSTEDELRHSNLRIEELKESKTLVKDMILRARDEGYNLEIDSAISIKLTRGCELNKS